MIQDLKTCNIYAPFEEDFSLLKDHIAKYPVYLSSKLPENFDPGKPSLIVGWDHVKLLFEGHNIHDKRILDNIFWIFSSKEDNKFFSKEIDEFLFDSLKKWLPNNYILFDPFFHGDINEFLEKNIDQNVPVYYYFNNGGLYINNCSKNFILNLKTLSLVLPDFKNFISNLLLKENSISFSFSNIAPYVISNQVLYLNTLENILWTKFGVEIEEGSFFNVVPGIDIKKHIAFLMSQLPLFSLNELEKKSLKRLCEKDFIVRWLSTRKINFDETFIHNDLDFLYLNNQKLASLNYSHKRTLTGRIVCKDVYNPQNLSKEGDDKKKIVTRFNKGKILVCDYVSFESKIALYLSEDKEFIEKYYRRDLHLESASIIYGPYQPIYSEERKLAKDINHAIMFGAGEEMLLSKLAFLKNPEIVLGEIRSFLSPILNKSFEINKIQQEQGFIVNDWGYIMTPKKDFASFNNLIQSTAAEILVDKIFEVKELLKDKKSEFLFPVHDSMVFDLSPDEFYLKTEILHILSKHKNKVFAVSYKLGENYKETEKEEIFFP